MNKTAHPRINKGIVTPAYKERREGEKKDFLIINSYFATFLKTKPYYWDNLLKLLYDGGRWTNYASMVEDIVDKFSFLFLSKDKINHYESLLDWTKSFYIKYFTYSFIYLSKSFLDSLAVLLNYVFELGFSGGDIDFKKQKFIEGIESKDKELAKLITAHKKWIDNVIKYRGNLIHRHSLYVGPLPTIPPEITDEKEIDLYILQEPFYLPNDPDLTDDLICINREGEFIKLGCFVDEWLEEATNLFHIVLGNFAENFIRASWKEKIREENEGSI